ncbi:MAG: PD-(D/E)XK nuclease family protein [Brevundimonas sp.]
MNAVAFPTVTIRASSLTSYMDCPRRAAANMFRREVEDAGYTLNRLVNGIASAIGTGVHAGAAISLEEKARSGALPPLSVATDAAMDSLKERVAEGVTFETRGTAQNQTHAETHVLRMTEAYHRVVAPTVEPVIVETRLEAEVAPGIILSGQADVIAREPGKVRDLKTSTKVGKTHNPQIGAYSLLARSAGIDVTGAQIDLIVRTSLKNPQPDPVSTGFAIETVENAASNVLRHIQGDLHVFRHGDPEQRVLPGDAWAFPANPSSMLCGPKYCSAWGTAFCAEHAKTEESE